MVMVNQPSYIRKADWAERHLIDLALLLDAFATQNPYTVTDPVKNKHGQLISTLEFTQEPDPDGELIVGDIIYNLRASFDYLIGSLVPSGERSKVLCPVLHEPVWEIPFVATENSERTKNRERWESLARHIRSEEAVAALKELMPLEYARRESPKEHALDLINRLSNKDRHQRLPILTWGIGDVRARMVTRGSGQIVPCQILGISDPMRQGFENHAEIPLPDKAVYVKLSGTPVVLVRIGEERQNFRVPAGFLGNARLAQERSLSQTGAVLQAHVTFSSIWYSLDLGLGPPSRWPAPDITCIKVFRVRQGTTPRSIEPVTYARRALHDR